jgi:hypothetical protein
MTPRLGLWSALGCTWLLMSMAVQMSRAGEHWLWVVEPLGFASFGVWLAWRWARVLARERTKG